MAMIIIVSQRLLGHMIPVLGLGVELLKNNHKVCMLGHSSNRSVIEQAGLTFFEIGWDRFPEMYIEEMIHDIVAYLKNNGADLVICDSSLAAPAYVAELYGIPWISYQTTVPLSDEMVPGNKIVNQRLRERYKNELDRIRIKMGLHKLDNFINTRGDFVGLSPNLHLVMVFSELIPIHHEHKFPQSFRYVGACSYEEELLFPSVKQSLSKVSGENVILVCTSSVPRVEFKNIIDHYVKVSMDAFRSNHLYTLVIMDHQTNSLQNRRFSNINWVSDYPAHHHLLPFADVVITHGGCGTIQKCMKYGVPMAIIPLGADHPFLAKRCEEIGIAISINLDEVEEDNLKKTVQRLLEEESFSLKAKQLSVQIKKYEPNKTCANLVEQFIHSWEENHAY